jgi:hypothetical protein
MDVISVDFTATPCHLNSPLLWDGAYRPRSSPSVLTCTSVIWIKSVKQLKNLKRERWKWFFLFVLLFLIVLGNWTQDLGFKGKWILTFLESKALTFPPNVFQSFRELGKRLIIHVYNSCKSLINWITLQYQKCLKPSQVCGCTPVIPTLGRLRQKYWVQGQPGHIMRFCLKKKNILTKSKELNSEPWAPR